MPSLISYQRLKVLTKHFRCFSTASKSFTHLISSNVSSTFAGLQLCRSVPLTLTNKLKICSSLHSSFCVKSIPYSTIYDTFDDQPTSWLFVSDSVAGAYGAQVNLDLELERRLGLSSEHLKTLRCNLDLRQIKFDLDSLVSDFEKMTALIQERQHLIARKEHLFKQLKGLKIENNGDEQSLSENRSNELEECKRNLKDLMNRLWSLEEGVMTTALQLPNDLHPVTPVTESTVIEERASQRVLSHTLSHVEIGRKFDLIKFSNVGPQAYYLKGELAHLARKLSDSVCDYFLQQDYRLMSGPEFFKTPIMESCGHDVYDTREVLTLRQSSNDVEPMTHLAGVSPMTFAAYVAKLCIGDSSLPLRMFSIGPRYQTGNGRLGLYGAGQTSQVAIFSCTSQNDLDTQYNEMVDTVWNLLSVFGFSIRMIQCCASKLRREERRRTDMEIWAPSMNQFIPIAHVSDLGDFVSRRQMSIHNKNHADIRHTKLLHMLSGTAINMTTLLAVWMEHSHIGSNQFSLLDLPVVSGNDKALK